MLTYSVSWRWIVSYFLTSQPVSLSEFAELIDWNTIRLDSLVFANRNRLGHMLVFCLRRFIR
jgi:hypothetical protein